jgi:hypothetical protein
MPVSNVNTLSKEDIRINIERAVSQRKEVFNFSHRLASGTVRDVEIHSGPIEAHGRHPRSLARRSG